MKIYRAVKDILYKNVNHLYQSNDLTWNDYGKGTSYAYEISGTDDYLNFCKNFAWRISSSFNPSNIFYLEESHLMDMDELSEGFFIDGEHFENKELSEYANQKGYDCVYFNYEDPHILLLDKASEPDVLEVELFTEKQDLVNELKKLKLKNDGTIFKIPLNKIPLVDEILEKLYF